MLFSDSLIWLNRSCESDSSDGNLLITTTERVADMALIDCYECGKQISDAALACPRCGALSKRFKLSQYEELEIRPFHKLIIVCLFIGATAFGFCIGFIALSNG